MSVTHDEIQQTYLIAELIKTQAQLRESVESLTVTLQKLQANGLPQSLPRTLTVEDAAEFCKVRPETIRNWASSGKIPHHKANGSLFFVANELLEWTKTRSKR